MSYTPWPFRPPASWQQTPVRPVIRSEIEDGQPKVRRRFTKIRYNYQASFRLHWSDHDRFWQFYEIDCAAGAVPFKIKHPITDEELTVRFATEPQIDGSTNIKPWFDISARLELVI